MNYFSGDISTYELYIRSITFIAPAFCSLICALFVLFLIRSCKNRVERLFRTLASLYFLMITLWWLSLFGYAASAGSSLAATVALGFAYVFIPVLFYHTIYYPTHIGRRRFPPLNYLLPIPLLAAILAIVALTIPAGNALPDGGVEAVIKRSVSMFVHGPLRLLPALVYAIPTGLLLVRHRREIIRYSDDGGKHPGERPLVGIAVFISLGAALLALGIIPLFIREGVLWVAANGAVMSAQTVMLTYHIMRRQYIANPAAGSNVAKVRAGRKKKGDKGIVTGWISSIVEHNGREGAKGGELSRVTLENYFHVKRPYTDPGFKLTDLAGAMGVNRSQISGFINREYGMNFKRYVNRWRIKEFQRLMALPSNERKNPYKILPLAGFSDSRHYQRALQTESGGSGGSGGSGDNGQNEKQHD